MTKWKRLGRMRGLFCRSCHASYSVEASFVMAIVLFSLAALIGTAFDRSRETAGTMRLQHALEVMRGQADEERKEFSASAWSGSAEKDGDQVTGSVCGNGWQKEISVHIHEPENMMRMLTIFDGKDGEAEGEGDGDDDGDDGA